MLKSKGVKKGDRVAIYMPMVNELVVAMLACARIGAVHSIVFGGYSAESLASRIEDGGCKVLVTADGVWRGPKVSLLIQIKNARCSHRFVCNGTDFFTAVVPMMSCTSVRACT